MYVGLPIIATNKGGQTDLITKNNGILINPRSPKEIEKTIKFLIQNLQIRKKMSINNKKKIKNYHISKIAKKYINLFQKLI